VQQLRLICSLFYVDVRLREFNGRWLASADTPDGPSLGWGMSPIGALWLALEPFDGVIDELLASAPAEIAAPFSTQTGN
jgi:hypothetical protein